MECVWWCVGPHGWSWCCYVVQRLSLSLAKVWNVWPCTAKARHANVFLVVKSMVIAAWLGAILLLGWYAWTCHDISHPFMHCMVAWNNAFQATKAGPYCWEVSNSLHNPSWYADQCFCQEVPILQEMHRSIKHETKSIRKQHFCSQILQWQLVVTMTLTKDEMQTSCKFQFK